MTDSGYRSLFDMTAEIGRLIHDTSTGRKTAIKDAINRAYEGACNAVEWPQFQMVDASGLRLLSDTGLMTLEAGEPEFPLPIGTGRLLSLHFQDASEQPIQIVPAPELFDKAGSQLNTTGRPRYACPIGQTAQIRRLPDDSQLTAFSPNSSSNDNVLSPSLEFRRSGSNIGHEAVLSVLAGNFTTGVTIGAEAASGYAISKVILPDGWVGLFTIEDETGLVVVRLPTDYIPAATAANHAARVFCSPLFRVWPIPDIDYALTICWIAQPRLLVENEDTPEIPISSYLVEKATAEMLRHENKEALARSHEAEAASYLRGKSNRERPPAFVGQLRRGNFLRATDVRNA